VSEELVSREEVRLTELVAVVDSGLKTFYEVGMALAEIRDSRYYQVTHDTFEGFCRDRWGMTKRYANYLVASSEVVDNLGTNVPTPKTEAVARPLVKLNPDQQREAWAKAIQTAPEGGVTARHVYKIVKDMTEEKKEPEKKKPILKLDVPQEPELISSKFQAAFEAMVSAIKNEKGLKWKETSKKDALKCVSILADIITI